MRQKIRLYPMLVVLVLITASLATWAAWSPAVSQSIDPKLEECRPAGKDTVSLETRKQLLADREDALLARRKAAMAARELQMNTLAVEVSSRASGQESTHNIVMQLIPYLNQPRVLKWNRETLAGT